MTVLVRVFMEKTQPVALATHTAWVQLWFQPYGGVGRITGAMIRET